MIRSRTVAVTAGVLYLITHVASIAALALYDPVLGNPGYVLGAGADTRVLWGTFLEAIVALAVVGTAVTLFPVIRRQHEGVALGYVGLRTLEAALISMGLVSIASVVTLRGSDAEPTALVAAGEALVAIHDWTFLFGPNVVLGVNTVLIAYLMYRSGLVPRPIALLGLAGGPLIFVSAAFVLFDVYEQLSVWGAVAAVPVFAWELSLAFWLVIKGFRNTPAIAAIS